MWYFGMFWQTRNDLSDEVFHTKVANPKNWQSVERASWNDAVLDVTIAFECKTIRYTFTNPQGA